MPRMQRFYSRWLSAELGLKGYRICYFGIFASRLEEIPGEIERDVWDNGLLRGRWTNDFLRLWYWIFFGRRKSSLSRIWIEEFRIIFLYLLEIFWIFRLGRVIDGDWFWKFRGNLESICNTGSLFSSLVLIKFSCELLAVVWPRSEVS